MENEQKPLDNRLVIGIVVLLVAVGGTFFLLNRDNANTAPITTETQGEYQNQISSESIEAGKVPFEPYVVEVAWQKLVKLPEDKCTTTPSYSGNCDYSVKYLAGKITNGELKGYDLYLRARGEMGGDYYDHYVMYEDKLVSLEESLFTINGISDLPETIAFPNSTYKMRKWYSASMLFSDVTTVKKLFTIAGLGDFYLTDFGCIMMELPDGTAIAYDFVLPFVNAEENTIDFTYTSGIKNKEEYEFIRIGGCGATCMYLADIPEDTLKPEVNLMKVAKTSNGEDVYGYKDAHNTALQDLYNDPNTLPYMSDGTWERLPKNKYSYEQYTALNPLLYWKDPLGRWIEFKNKKFLIAAEKCKPVIYLYPTKITALNVQVKPNGGFTKTIPEYPEGGWEVTAYPDGKVVERATGTSYPYLYWSGIGLNYPINEEEGWVIKKEDVAKFLDSKLPLLGMNEKEIADFKEYWVSKLSDMPYYQISFLPKNQLDQMAPLAVSPVRPDSVIRVMMTAKGLNEPEKLKEQVLPKTPERKGFVLVEWGGTLLR